MLAAISARVAGVYWKVAVLWRTYQLYNSVTAGRSRSSARRTVRAWSAAQRAARASLSALVIRLRAASCRSASLLSAQRRA